MARPFRIRKISRLLAAERRLRITGTYRFQGSKGALEVTEFGKGGGGGVTFIPQAGKDESPCYYMSGYPVRDA